MKRFTTFIFVVASVIYTFGQNESLSISIKANLTPPFSINGFARDDLALSSDPSMGYEGCFSYSRSLTERAKIEIGILGGVQSYNFSLFFKDSFIDYHSFQQDFFLEKISEFDLEYYGFSLGLRYRLFLLRRSSIGILTGVNAIYFLHQDHYFSYSAVLSNNQVKDFFYAHSDINPEDKILIAPNFGIYCTYRLNKRMELGIRFNGIISNRVIMKNSYEEPYFLIYGDNETVKGTWVKRFRQVGVGLSVSYLLNS